LKLIATDLLAVVIYFPLSQIALFLENIGLEVKNFPLSYYRRKSFYTMRTDSRDRFGTPLEQRFSKVEIEKMMKDAGLKNIRFSKNQPFWVAVGIKA